MNDLKIPNVPNIFIIKDVIQHINIEASMMLIVLRVQLSVKIIFGNGSRQNLLKLAKPIELSPLFSF